MGNYELPISPNYVSNWGIKEAIREILQNAIDSDKNGYKKEIEYDEENNILYIKNKGARLSKSSLVLGCSNKSDIDGMIGKFGEGYKLALVVLLRKGLTVEIFNGKEYWEPSFKHSDKYNTQILNINISEVCLNDDLTFRINGVENGIYKDLLNYFPCINDDYGETIETSNGSILFDDRFNGKMFVEGLYVQSDDNFKYGYNFSSDIVDLDRDRKAINYYELRKLTAESVVTAEECNTQLFKAISDSYTDIKDIKDVLDDASETFLTEYRDMLYEQKDLEENTLVATESVMKQLQQMDVDVPVVKGTEIESYLIAKANDKLGLIYEAQEAVSRRSEEDDAWSYVRNSNWFKLKCWFEKYCKRTSKIGKENFDKILNGMTPYDLHHIKKYIPDDFEWSVENFIVLEEQTKNQT